MAFSITNASDAPVPDVMLEIFGVPSVVYDIGTTWTGASLELTDGTLTVTGLEVPAHDPETPPTLELDFSTSEEATWAVQFGSGALSWDTDQESSLIEFAVPLVDLRIGPITMPESLVAGQTDAEMNIELENHGSGGLDGVTLSLPATPWELVDDVEIAIDDGSFSVVPEGGSSYSWLDVNIESAPSEGASTSSLFKIRFDIPIDVEHGRFLSFPTPADIIDADEQSVASLEISGSDSVPVQQANLTATTAFPDELTAGAPDTFTVVVENSGQNEATNLTLDFSYGGMSGDGFSFDPLLGDGSEWSLDRLGVDETHEFQLVVTPIDTIEANDGDEFVGGSFSLSSDQATIMDIEVNSLNVRQYDITTRIEGPTLLVRGQEITQTVTFRNIGDRAAQAIGFNLVYEDPDNLGVTVSPLTSGWTPDEDGPADYIWNEPLAPGDSTEVMVDVAYPLADSSDLANPGAVMISTNSFAGETQDDVGHGQESSQATIDCVDPTVSVVEKFPGYPSLDPTPEIESGAVHSFTYSSEMNGVDELLLEWELTIWFPEFLVFDSVLLPVGDSYELLTDGSGASIGIVWQRDDGTLADLHLRFTAGFAMYSDDGDTEEEVPYFANSASYPVRVLVAEDEFAELGRTVPRSEYALNFVRAMLAFEFHGIEEIATIKAADPFEFEMTLANAGRVALVAPRVAVPIPPVFDQAAVPEIDSQDASLSATYLSGGGGPDSLAIIYSGSIAVDDSVAFSVALATGGQVEDGTTEDVEFGRSQGEADNIGDVLVEPTGTLGSTTLTISNSAVQIIDLKWTDAEGGAFPDDIAEADSVVHALITLGNTGSDATQSLALTVQHPDSTYLEYLGDGDVVGPTINLHMSGELQPGDEPRTVVAPFRIRHRTPNRLQLPLLSTSETPIDEPRKGQVRWTTARWTRPEYSELTTNLEVANYELRIAFNVPTQVERGAVEPVTISVDNIGRKVMGELVVRGGPTDPTSGSITNVIEDVGDVSTEFSPLDANRSQFIWTVRDLLPPLDDEGVGSSVRLTADYLLLSGTEITIEFELEDPRSENGAVDSIVGDLELVYDIVLVGPEVLELGVFPTPYAGVGPARIVYRLRENVRSVEYRILDVRGRVVARSDGPIVGPRATSFGVGQIDWNGQTRGGGVLVNGVYFVDLEIIRMDGTPDRRIQKLAIIR